MAEGRGGDSPPRNLTAAVDRALAVTQDLLAQRERAIRRLDEVERRGGPEQAMLVARNQQGLAGPGLVMEMIQRAVGTRNTNPRVCRAWADAAVVSAEQLPDPRHRSLRARAWAEKGNAERIAEDFAAARQSFQRAVELLETAGGGVLSYRGDVYSLLGSLEIALNRHEAALGCLALAIDSYEALAQQDDAHKVLIKRASVLSGQGALAPALRDLVLVAKAAVRDDLPSDSSITLSACLNMLWVLVEVALSTRCEEERKRSLNVAFQGLAYLAPLYSKCPNPAWSARFRWLLGRLYLANGKLREAEIVLDETVAEFLELDLPTTAAVATLDLALVFAQQGEFGELRAVAGAACAVFEAKGLEADTWAAQRMLLDCDLARAETLIIESLKKVGGASLHRTPGKVSTTI